MAAAGNASEFRAFQLDTTYNAKGQITHQDTYTIRTGDTWSSETVNSYGSGTTYALGQLVSSTRETWLNNANTNSGTADEATSTTHSFDWYSGPLIKTITYDPDSIVSQRLGSNLLLSTTTSEGKPIYDVQPGRGNGIRVDNREEANIIANAISLGLPEHEIQNLINDHRRFGPLTSTGGGGVFEGSGQGVGRWVAENFGSSPTAKNGASYAKFALGTKPGTAYRVNNVNFDGFTSGVLQEAKGNYDWAVDQYGEFKFEGIREQFLDQVIRQTGAAGNTPIEWVFQQQSVLNATKNLFNRTGNIDITYTHKPYPKGRKCYMIFCHFGARAKNPAMNAQSDCGYFCLGFLTSIRCLRIGQVHQGQKRILILKGLEKFFGKITMMMVQV